MYKLMVPTNAKRYITITTVDRHNELLQVLKSTWPSSGIKVQSFVVFHVSDDGHKLGRNM